MNIIITKFHVILIWTVLSSCQAWLQLQVSSAGICRFVLCLSPHEVSTVVELGVSLSNCVSRAVTTVAYGLGLRA